MLEQAGVEIIWYAHFVEAGLGKTGLAPSLTVYKDDSATPEVNAAATVVFAVSVVVIVIWARLLREDR